MIPILKAYASLIILIVASTFLLRAQEENAISEQWIENIAEEIVSRSEDDVDLTELLAHLQDLEEHPLNLNHAKAEELEELHMLNEFQIASLLDYISHNGELVSIYELQYVPGFTIEIAGMLKPFVVTSLKDRIVDGLEEISQMNAKGTVIFRTQQTVEKQNGFNRTKDSVGNLNPSAFIGSPGKYFLQYSYQFSNHLNAGLTMEKDNGEPFISKGKYPLPDFTSAHVIASDIGIIRKLAIGDFQIGFGQGLTWWSGYSFGKTACLQNLRKTGQGIKASISSNENRFMRGIGTCLEIGKFDLSLFLSRKKIDANITKYDSLQNEPVSFSSFQTTGIHSTASEIADKDAIQELITGGHITLKREHLRVGASFVQTNWNASYEPSPASYKLFSFRGKSATNAGLDYEARFENVSLFGELATCAMGGGAILQGVSLDFQHKVYLSVIYRDYGRSYFSPYSTAFAESSSPSNERGVYTGISLQPWNHMVITSYLDIYDFPWLKYRVSQPSSGSDFYIQNQYIVNNKYEFTLRFQKECGMLDESSLETGIPPANKKSTQKVRLAVSVSPRNNLILSSRIELQKLVQPGLKDERGFLLIQDLDYKFQNVPLKIVTRFAIFETDSYNSRIYGFESDMLHVYSIPAFYGKGLRYSILVQYKISKQYDLWIKLGRTIYPDQTTIGNDAEQINSNHKTDFGIELRAKF
jgi:hypothetical protein